MAWIMLFTGGRLDLSRLLSLPRGGKIAFLAAASLFLVGLVVSSVRFEQGVRLAGMGLIALALWLLRYDIAWRTVRQTGLPRFIAVSLLLGYAWLVVGGVLTLGYDLTEVRRA